MSVKLGSIWSTSDRKEFIVINVVDAPDGHRWIHYREHHGISNVKESKEYSCYEESFVHRFTEVLA